MNTGELGGELLASVSRSFYITIKALPRKIRAPIGLAYLLARATDTIADSTDAPPAIRLQHLEAMRGMIDRCDREQTGDSCEALARLKDEINPADPPERALITKLDRCFEWLRSMPQADRADITSVLRTITHGQELDLLRFGNQTGVATLQTSEELDEYTYLVAGCVGEFWTRVCFRHLPRYARLDEEQMRLLGIDFGKGLQLVNILRDIPADLKSGRCYLPLPEAELTAGMLKESPERGRELFELWLGKAEAHLDSACDYIAAISSWRLRFACILPWFIGMRTLALLRKSPPLETERRIKVSRGEVRVAMIVFAPIAAASNHFLRRLQKRLKSAV